MQQCWYEKEFNFLGNFCRNLQKVLFLIISNQFNFIIKTKMIKLNLTLIKLNNILKLCQQNIIEVM